MAIYHRDHAGAEARQTYLITTLPPEQLNKSLVEQVASHCVHFSHDLTQARRVIASCELDVIIYLEATIYHMSYLLGFARLAPIQCMWGGLPVTTGIPNMDYFLTTEGAEPGNRQEHYTETPLCFDRWMCYFNKPVISPPSKEKTAYGLIGGDVHNYLCPVMPHKLHPDMDEIFAQILARDAKAQIVLMRDKHEPFQRSLERRVRKTVPNEYHDRLHFIPFVTPGDFPHLLLQADAVLDTLHLGFGTTAFIAFGAGVPFVTYRGEFVRGRIGAHMYDQMGMTHWVAESKEEYVEKALSLAADPQKQEALSQTIREKSSILFDDPKVVTDLKSYFKELLQKHSSQVA